MIFLRITPDNRRRDGLIRAVFAIVALALLSACATSPLGRSQLQLFSDQYMAGLGNTAFNQIKAETEQVTEAETRTYVSCVATAIVRASALRDDWEIVVFAEDRNNAFALPGNNIGVYRGILEVASNQDMLATVIAHEIAHVASDHANERLSNAFAAQAGLDIASIVIGKPSAEKSRIMALLGLGTQVGVLLPFSRAQEQEADLVGLRLMAQAGFDPRQAPALWRAMMASERWGAPPELLSTHPADRKRIRYLELEAENVLPLFDDAAQRGRRPDCHG